MLRQLIGSTNSVKCEMVAPLSAYDDHSSPRELLLPDAATFILAIGIVSVILTTDLYPHNRRIARTIGNGNRMVKLRKTRVQYAHTTY